MKLAIISDTQIGARQDYTPFLELNKRFFHNIFFPELEKRNIKVIIHLGDLVDRRRYINYQTAKYLKEDFFDPIVSGGYHLHWIFGNHDIYFRETAEVNAADILAPNSIYKYRRATDVVFDGCQILFIPWITKETYDYSLRLIRESPASVAFGHLELQGFQMDQFQVSKSGFQPDILDRFDLVLTGHYHHRSIKRNIYYVGSHAEFSWSEAGDKHGFHIFDTETHDVEFVENPYSIFHKVFFDGTNVLSNPADLTGKIVKVVVQAKHDQAAYNNFMQQVEEANPLDITTVDNYLNANLTDENIVSDTKDTLTIMREYIQSVPDTQVNKEKLDGFIVSLYKQANEEM